MEETPFNVNTFQNDNYSSLAVFSYIPLIGWLIPLYKRKEDRFSQHHAKQGFVLAVFFVLTIISLNILNIFIPKEWRDICVAIVISTYAISFLYIIICLVCAFTTFKGKKFDIPLINKFTNLIEL